MIELEEGNNWTNLQAVDWKWPTGWWMNSGTVRAETYARNCVSGCYVCIDHQTLSVLFVYFFIDAPSTNSLIPQVLIQTNPNQIYNNNKRNRKEKKKKCPENWFNLNTLLSFVNEALVRLRPKWIVKPLIQNNHLIQTSYSWIKLDYFLEATSR